MKDNAHIVVVANGRFAHTGRLLAVLDGADAVIAADGGANWLTAQGRAPDLLVGDMDSVASDVLERLEKEPCRVRRHSRHKDETDTELALLEAASMGAGRITLLGALGGRIDHQLANIYLLLLPQLAGIETLIFDGRSFLSIVSGTGDVVGQAGDLVSLLPLGGDAEGVVLSGFQYPLRNETLYFGPARGVSNILTQSVGHIKLQQGRLLIVHTPRRYLEKADE